MGEVYSFNKDGSIDNIVKYKIEDIIFDVLEAISERYSYLILNTFDKEIIRIKNYEKFINCSCIDNEFKICKDSKNANTINREINKIEMCDLMLNGGFNTISIGICKNCNKVYYYGDDYIKTQEKCE
jgi:hypothetical protein